MDLRKKDLRGPALQEMIEAGHDLVGADLRRADLRGADLQLVDLRGTDLRGADLRDVTHLTLTELVDFVKGEWIGLVAWDRKTQFPEEFEQKLWTLGLRETNGTSRDAIRRGLAAVARTPLVKGDWQDVIPHTAYDG